MPGLNRSVILAIVIAVLLVLGLYQVLPLSQTGKTMSELPSEIFKHWFHSYEDDADGITVYRPSDYAFPPARGRAGMGFQADGTFANWAIAPTDGSQMIGGYWRIEASGHIHVTFDDTSRAPWVLEIVSVDANMLKVRRR